MTSQNIAGKALLLAEEFAAKLERWLALFELRLRAAEEEGVPPDLKDLVAYTTALKRLLEIAKIAEILSPEADNDGLTRLDFEAIRAAFREED